MRNRKFIFIVAGVAAAALSSVGCSSSGSGPKVDVKSIGLRSESDSLSYIVGLNIAEQMMKMDSLINFEVACRAIIEHSKGESLMNIEDAKVDYLRYLLYVEPERRRGYETKFLNDLVASDRTFKRTKSGLTYKIEVIGDEKNTAKSSSDWVEVRYTISRVDGEVVAKGLTAEEPLNDHLNGITESVKLIGEGGRIRSWMPSELAYGEGGDEELGVNPTETLLFDIEVVKVERNAATNNKNKRDVKEF
ncbi:MAG: FKBP-type peptidyl-prolyl cis-trans isomerase [Rikenellaceae bacterium]